MNTNDYTLIDDKYSRRMFVRDEYIEDKHSFLSYHCNSYYVIFYYLPYVYLCIFNQLILTDWNYYAILVLIGLYNQRTY